MREVKKLILLMPELEQRIAAFAKLGLFMAQDTRLKEDAQLKGISDYFAEGFEQVKKEAELYNHWFTPENIEHALKTWSETLTEKNLRQWTEAYPPDHWNGGGKTVAVIMAGNLPLVGFHDFLTVLMTGNKILAKPSSDDQHLLPFLAQILVAIDKDFAPQIEFAEGNIKNFDAVIATGSNNSARYFEQYFGKYPHIIRKNRTGVAVLDGSENAEDLHAFSEDVFRYFGLGCRNVSKAYLPKGFDTNRIFEAFYNFKHLAEHTKYGNNFDYNRAIYLMEKQPFLENGFFVMKEDERIHAPVSVMHYEYYDDLEAVHHQIRDNENNIQCVVSNLEGLSKRIPFGSSQKPGLMDYADQVDTVKFLAELP